MAEAATAEVTRDTLFGGRLVLNQPTSGHRVGTDAVLLASAVAPDFVGTVIDAGAGVGAVGLRIAQASPSAAVTLIENDPTYLALAIGNVTSNGVADRVMVLDCDLMSTEACRPFAATADLVVTNPPFYRANQVRASPVASRRAAHVLGSGGLGGWLDDCLALLAPKGTFVLIHQACALAEILERLDRRLGAITLLSVHPRTGEAASRVLVRGTKGSRGPLRIAPALVLHEGQTFTPEAAGLHAGTSSLAW